MIKVGIQVPTDPKRNVMAGPSPKPRVINDKVIGISSPSQTYNGIPMISAKKKAKKPDEPIYFGMASSGIRVDSKLAITMPIKKYFPSSFVIFQKLLRNVTFSDSSSQPHLSEVEPLLC